MPTKEIDVEPIEINDELYYTVKQFALLTNRTEQSVRRLINEGNRVRKLFSKKIGHTILVPHGELVAFPFTVSGHAEQIYHYELDAKGKTKAVMA